MTSTRSLAAGAKGSPSPLSNVTWHYHGHRDKITLHHMPIEPNISLAPQSQHQPTSTPSEERHCGNCEKLQVAGYLGMIQKSCPNNPYVFKTYIHIKRIHLQHQIPLFRDPKNKAFFLSRSSINLCPPGIRPGSRSLIDCPSWGPNIEALNCAWQAFTSRTSAIGHFETRVDFVVVLFFLMGWDTVVSWLYCYY